MELEQIHEKLKCYQSEHRYEHSLGVEQVAIALAKSYSCSVKKAAIAGILHDCAKQLSDETLLANCERNHIQISDTERRCPFLLHGKVGALYAKEVYGIEDEEILSAITYHTTGRKAMSLLEKIIFTADYIEPGRKPFPRMNEIRIMAYQDIDRAIVMILENMLSYLTLAKRIIDQTTIETYQYYKNELLMT